MCGGTFRVVMGHFWLDLFIVPPPVTHIGLILVYQDAIPDCFYLRLMKQWTAKCKVLKVICFKINHWNAVKLKEMMLTCGLWCGVCVIVWSVDVALDSIQSRCSVGKLHFLLHLQLPGVVGRVVAGPGVPGHSECDGVNGTILAHSCHFRLIGRRTGLCRQLAHHWHQADHHRSHPADSATYRTLSTPTS